MSRCPLSKDSKESFFILYSLAPLRCNIRIPAARSINQNPARDFLFNLFEPPTGAMSRCPLSKDSKESFFILYSLAPSRCNIRIPAARSINQNPARDFLFNLFEPPTGAMSRCPLSKDSRESFFILYSLAPSRCNIRIPAARSINQNPARDFLFNLFKPPTGRCPAVRSTINLDKVSNLVKVF
jgi:hypothetical protein